MSGNEENNTSSSYKWTYVPGKVYNFPPLNMELIKKQILDIDSEDEEEEETDQDSSFENDTRKLCGSDITGVLNKSFSAETPVDDPKNNTAVPQIMDTFLTERQLIKPPQIACGDKKEPNTLTPITENEENIPPSSQVLNAAVAASESTKNDSFNLDFSAMSLTTPVKKNNQMKFVTPKINIIPSSEAKSLIKSASLFKVPGVNRPNTTPSSCRTPMMKPPGSLFYSNQKQRGTPSMALTTQNNIFQTVYSSAVKPLIHSGGDEFSRLVVNNNEYVITKLLGKGGSSEVFSCFNPMDSFHVAIKVVNLNDSSSAEGYRNEVKLLESLQSCDRVITMYDHEIQNDILIMVLEEGRDFSAILKKISSTQNHIATYMIIYYWMEMLHAVQQIHAKGVIHSDLKPGNFIKVEQGLKLIDFGIASKVQGDMTSVFKTSQEGSCNYISPEALIQQQTVNANSPSNNTPKYKIHFKSDVWSLGCILYQLIYKKTPFQHINHIWAKLTEITNPRHKIVYKDAPWASQRLIKTVKRCLQYNVNDRPSVDELIDDMNSCFK